MTNWLLILVLTLTGSCGWKSPQAFNEKGAETSDTGADAGSDADVDLGDADRDTDAVP